MNVKDAIMSRRSIRAFEDRPVSRETLTEVLNAAVRAVSRKNIQPWEFAVVTGEKLRELSEENVSALKSFVPSNAKLEEPYRARQIEVAKMLFAAADVKRGDEERRAWWSERGYRYFDAPAAIIVYTGEKQDEKATNFDLGCVVQNICIAAMEFGLGTCVEYQGTQFPEVLHEKLGIGEDKKFVVAIAIGYPDMSFPANEVISPREEVDAVTKWFGF